MEHNYATVDYVKKIGRVQNGYVQKMRNKQVHTRKLVFSGKHGRIEGRAARDAHR